MPGRKRVPTRLKILKGTAQPCRLAKNEPVPEPTIPEPPAHLSERALEEWHRMVGELRALGLLTGMDRSALAAYCQAYARWCDAEDGIRELSKKGSAGLVIKTKNGNIIQSPLVGIANKAMELMLKFLTEFGMSPASRTRISAKPPGGGGKKSKWEE